MALPKSLDGGAVFTIIILVDTLLEFLATQ
jgi:hypothetical protein